MPPGYDLYHLATGWKQLSELTVVAIQDSFPYQRANFHPNHDLSVIIVRFVLVSRPNQTLTPVFSQHTVGHLTILIVTDNCKGLKSRK